MAAPLVPLVLLWLVGLCFGERLPLEGWHWLALAALAPLIVLGTSRRSPPHAGLLFSPSLYTTLLALALTLGAARGAAHRPDFAPSDLATYNDLGMVTVRGTVVRYPEARGSYTRYEVESSTIEVEEGVPATVTGRFLVNLPPYPPYQYGDELRLSGELITPPMLEDFDYRAFLAHKGIYSLLRQGHGSLVAQGQGSILFRVLFAFRERAEHTVQQILPEPHAALMSGILLGIESGIPKDVMEAFNTTGTTHVLVISGSNFAILSAIFLVMGRALLGEKRGSLVAIAAILLYALLVGGDPPVMRAAIMGIISILALLLRRESAALNTLAFAVLMMTALQPGQLYDVGFQLSVLATLGLILLVNPLTGWTERFLEHHLGLPEQMKRRVLPLLGDALLITLAAQIITTPLIVGTFGRFSVISLLTNLLILPVQSWLLASGGIATLAGMLWLPLGKFLAAVPYAALAWTLAMVRWTAQFPLASLTIGPFPTWCIWSLYGALALWWWQRTPAPAPVPEQPAPALVPLVPRRTAIRWGGALLVAFLPWWVGAQQADGRLHLYALDVGQGDALLIVAPDGKQILIDGGPDPVPLLAELGEQLPPWDRTIELVILSHADADHLGGLPELLSRYRLVQVMDSGHGHTTALYRAWESALAAQSLAPLTATPGQRWHLGDGAVLEVLAPTGEPFESLNDNAVVLRLSYGNFCALLTGDIEAEAEARLVRSGQLARCQLLKVAHHGSKTSSTQTFLDATEPRYALISAGRDNRFGHPHAEVLARLEAMGVQSFRTDTQGTIHLMTDGREVWMTGEK
ncbi:MAG: DNA internalization-related competence protein ComEC/Rec2 [Ardenticatenales bacterium]|nr:DNA internalization-related competence protein ComEC/Rec2 [Ardenticatenales bacterium]